MIRNDSHFECISCSWVWRYGSEREQQLKTNEKDIIKDYIKLGARRTKKKWQMSGRTLYKMPSIQLIRITKIFNSLPEEYREVARQSLSKEEAMGNKLGVCKCNHLELDHDANGCLAEECDCTQYIFNHTIEGMPYQKGS